MDFPVDLLFKGWLTCLYCPMPALTALISCLLVLSDSGPSRLLPHQYVHTHLNGYTIMFHDFIIIIVIISAIIAARVTSLRHSSTEVFTVLVPYLHRTFCAA